MRLAPPMALLTPLALLALACGSSTSATPSAPVDYTYVVDSMTLPIQAGQRTALSLDLDGDGLPDNALGGILSALAQSAGSGALDFQGATDAAVDSGRILMLADLRTTSLTDATGAHAQTWVGANPSPAPCTDPLIPSTCRKHLAGTGAFSISPVSPATSGVSGRVTSGAFNGGPGTLALQLDLAGSGAPVTLTLVGAKVSLQAVSAAGVGSGVLAGGIPASDVDNKLIPTLVVMFQDVIAADCTGTTPPDCGCATGSTGATLLALFDTSPADCALSQAEFRNNPLVQSLFQPDVNLGGTPALSVGIGFTAVKGTFPVP